ncbi:ribonuclease H-like domain-containing protein [Natribaculum luteum]|uniref:Ribonuclease H-like domain-containing protein n=1 Tax=Natribaculum luteum TaxID=1586232 RepID=A0ABD5NUN7_9EURY|nr:ribonuclease H-like domain-containing protein [Natribaculum luteum]
MAERDGVRLLALPPSVALERPIPALEDARGYFDPDGIVIPGPRREPRAVARARRVFAGPVVHPPLADAGPVTRDELDGFPIVTVQRGTILEEAVDALESALSIVDHVVLVCDDVTTTVRPTALETHLEYAAELAAAVPADGSGVTVLTGGLPADYDETWHLERTGEPLGVGRDPIAEADLDTDDVVSVRIHGTGPVESHGDARSISGFSLSRDGAVAVETLDADAFGIEAVTGVGPKTADRLENQGITTRARLLETDLETLRSLPGIGRDRAERMLAHAEVLETGEPRRLTDEPLPGENWERPPLCLDIETDGLSPTIVWQVGVYDPLEDSHRAFLEDSNPDDPRSVLQAFLDWLLGVYPDRALLTWNGWRFDYRHLGAFINRYLPGYAEEWERIPKLDCYLWAVRETNALLPGRTNRLADVAAALGYEHAGTGLDGAATAAAYERFRWTGAELEWDRHEAYCEDDCRALWHVYERLRDAPRLSAASSGSTGSTSERAGGKTGQTGLSDF